MMTGRRIQRAFESALVAALLAWGLALVVCGDRLLDALDRIISG